MANCPVCNGKGTLPGKQIGGVSSIRYLHWLRLPCPNPVCHNGQVSDAEGAERFGQSPETEGVGNETIRMRLLV